VRGIRGEAHPSVPKQCAFGSWGDRFRLLTLSRRSGHWAAGRGGPWHWLRQAHFSDVSHRLTTKIHSIIKAAATSLCCHSQLASVNRELHLETMGNCSHYVAHASYKPCGKHYTLRKKTGIRDAVNGSYVSWSSVSLKNNQAGQIIRGCVDGVYLHHEATLSTCSKP
jgi:hypothetical protein